MIYRDTACHRWSFYPSENFNFVKRIEATQFQTMPTTIVWQWSMPTIETFPYIKGLEYIKEDEWVSYSPENSNKIEDGFQSNQEYVKFLFNSEIYKVKFLKDDMKKKSCYATEMKCYNHNPTRRVCRRVLKSFPQNFAPPQNETRCCICLENFEDTPECPWTTTTCGHVFHGLCLMNLYDRAIITCPICRDLLVTYYK